MTRIELEINLISDGVQSYGLSTGLNNFEKKYLEAGLTGYQCFGWIMEDGSEAEADICIESIKEELDENGDLIQAEYNYEYVLYCY